jgi:acyl-CoA thioester hydrolase
MAPPPPAPEFHAQRTVDESHIDVNGHVNNVVFVQWMQDLAVHHWRALGGEALQEDAHGTWFARSHHIEYLKPALLGDQLTMRTWVAEARRVRSIRRYEFWRGDTLLARGETDWVFVDVTTGRPKSIPDGFIDLLRPEGDGSAPAC